MDVSAQLEPYRPYLAHVVSYYASNPSDIEDLVQETIIRAWRHYGTFRQESNLRTWLCSIARHVSIDFLEAKRDVLPLIDAEYIPAGVDSDPEHYVQIMQINEFVNSLSPKLRTALVLHDIEGYHQIEIARACGLPIGTVKSRINRAHERMRGMII